jgi:hypothetical protein
LSSKHVKVAVLNIKILLPVGVWQGLLLHQLAVTFGVSKAIKHFARGGMVFSGKELKRNQWKKIFDETTLCLSVS